MLRTLPAHVRAGTTAGLMGKDGHPLVRFHDLRHTFATLRAMEGVPPHVLKNWMGHADITTTMNIYSHVYDGDPRMEALVERLYGSEQFRREDVVQIAVT